MQKVHFCSGTTFETGDAIATSLLRYVMVLGRTTEYDVLEVPILRPDGSAGTATLMLSPVSQISAESLASDATEFVDEAFEALVVERTQQLLSPPSPLMERDSAITPALELTDY